MFSNASSGSIRLDRDLAERFGYTKRTLTAGEVANVTRCLWLKRTRYGSAGIGRKSRAELYITYADGTTATVTFDPDDLMWASRATGQGGVWKLDPDIVRVLRELGPAASAEPDGKK